MHDPVGQALRLALLPEVAKRIAEFTVTAVGSSPAETAALIKRESELYRALIAATGIKPEK
jgi:hypothetical protein